MESASAPVPVVSGQKMNDGIGQQPPNVSHFQFTSFSAARKAKGRPALRVQLSAPNLSYQAERTPMSAAQFTPPLTPKSSQGSESQPSPTRRVVREMTVVKPVSAELSPAPSVPTTFQNYLRAFYPFHPDTSATGEESQSSITIAINQGDIVLVHSVQPNGWADGTLLSTGARGWLPTNYCEAYDVEVMRHLCNSLTYVWEFIGERQDDDPIVFTRQDYVRGVIAGVRVLLERLECLSRDSPCVQGHTGLRRQRKGLLGDLSVFVKTAKQLTEQCQSGITTETLVQMLENILMRAFKVVTRAARFLDMWTQDVLLKESAPLITSPTTCMAPTYAPTGPADCLEINDAGARSHNAFAPRATPTVSHSTMPAAEGLSQPPSLPLPREEQEASAAHAPLSMATDSSCVCCSTSSSSSSSSLSTKGQALADAHAPQPKCRDVADYSTDSTNHTGGTLPHLASQRNSASLTHADHAALPPSQLQFLPHTNATFPTLAPAPAPPKHHPHFDLALDLDLHSTTAAAASAAAAASQTFSPYMDQQDAASAASAAAADADVSPQGTSQSANLQERPLSLRKSSSTPSFADGVTHQFCPPTLPPSSRLTTSARLPFLTTQSTTATSAAPVSPSNLPPISPASTTSPCSLSTGKRLSATHRASNSFKPSQSGRRDALASEKLTAAHDAYLGYIGAFIGGHLLSRSTMELLIMTQQSVSACQGLLTCVDEIWRRDFCRSSDVDGSKIIMHRRLAELVDATRDIFQSAEAVDNDAEVFLPEQGKRLMDAATYCVQSAGDCVAKTRAVIDRMGDFESESSTPVKEEHLASPVMESAPQRMPRSPRSAGMPRSPRRDLRYTEKPLPSPPINETVVVALPQPTRRPPPSPRAQPDRDFTSSQNDPTPAQQHLQADFLPARASSLPRSSFETVVLQAPSNEDAPKAPALNIEIPKTSFMDMPASMNESAANAITPERRNSAGVSLDSSVTGLSNFRNSNESVHSRASTRATTPDSADAGARQVGLQSSFGSLTDISPMTTKDCEDLEAQLMTKTYAHELVHNSEGQVTGGSLPALVEQLTIHDATPDVTFVNTFYLTFRLFTSPQEFAQTLVDRFDYVGGQQHLSKAVRLRVHNVFKGWLENHWQTDTDAEALETIIKFASEKLSVTFPLASGSLLALTSRVVEAHESAQPYYSLSKARATSNSVTSLDGGPCPAPNVTKSQLNLLRNRNGIQSCNILDFDALEIARQITIYTSKTFCAIRPEELLASEWTKKTSLKALNVKALAHLSTDLANLVAESILNYDDIKKRALTIKQWVKVAKKCLELNNYDSLMAIICSLNSSMVVRLYKTWAAVSQKTLARLDYLNTIVDISRNYAVLRQRVQSQVGACLPFMGIYLTDLTFIDVGNQAKRQLRGVGSETDKVSVINFDKHMKTAKVISDLQRFQVGYKLQPVPEMQEWMAAQMSRMRANEEANVAQYYRRSLVLEPRESSQAPPSQQQTALPGRPPMGRETTKEKFDAWLTRSHKQNDRDHSGLADGTADADQHLPRYFAKHGHIDADPKKTKKDGAGKANWGKSGDEVLDEAFNMNKNRRRSNSSIDHALDFKTKFEAVEPEPVFEEEVHGPENGAELDQTESVITDSTASASGESLEEPKKA
ncbi:MAG: hypothetical protein M1828_004221 [Chrysothrix sp. TS-e1954]|nr:MAG: hypothetical protein M1828_004221 [Chrysothrix sp. TS-e1954]